MATYQSLTGTEVTDPPSQTIDLGNGILQSDASPMQWAPDPSLEEQRLKQEEEDKQRGARIGRIHQAALDPETFFKDKKIPAGFDGERIRAKAINSSFIEAMTGRKVDSQEDSMDRRLARQEVAIRHFGGKGKDSEQDFFQQIRDNAGKEQSMKSIVSRLGEFGAKTGMLSIAQEDGRQGKYSFEEWKKTASLAPGYDPAKVADYYQTFIQSRRQTEKTVGDLGPQLSKIWKSVKSGEGNVYSDIYDTYDALPATEDRDRFKAALHAVVTTLPKEVQFSFWDNFKKQSGRELTGNAITVLGTDYFHEFLQMGLAEDTSEGQAKEDDEDRRFDDFKADILKIAQNDYDPVRHLAPDDSLAQELEKGIYASPGAISSTLVAAIPFVGQAGFYSIAYEGAYQSYRQQFEANGMSYEDARDMAKNLAGPGAALEMVAERFQVRALAGKMPLFEKALQSVQGKMTSTLARFGTRVAVGAAQEGMLEKGQDTIYPALQELAHALGAEVSDQQWLNGKNGILDGFWRESAGMIVTMLPLSVFGGARGAIADSVRVKEFRAASDTRLLALGVRPEDLEAFRAANGIGQAATVLDRAVANLDPQSEAAKAAVETLKAQLEAIARSKSVADLPRVVRDETGWTVIDKETNEPIGTGMSIDDAMKIVGTNYEGVEPGQKIWDRMMTSMQATDIAFNETLKADPAGKATMEVDIDRKATQASLQAEGADIGGFLEESAMHEQANGGDGQTVYVALGDSETEVRKGIRTYTQRLFKGGTVLTVFHEMWHNARKRAISRGKITRDDQVGMLRMADKVLAERAALKPSDKRLTFLPAGIADADLTERMIDEGMAELGEIITLLDRKKMADPKGFSTIVLKNALSFSRGNGKTLVSLLDAVKGALGLSMSRVAILRKAQRDGKLDLAQIQSKFSEMTGLAEQDSHDEAAQAAAAEIDPQSFSLAPESTSDHIPMSAVNVLHNDSRVLPKPGKKRKNENVAAELERVAIGHWGRKLTSVDITEKEIREIIQMGVDEFAAAFHASGKSASNWYSVSIEVAMKVAAVIHPELRDPAIAAQAVGFKDAEDPVQAANLAMKMALAITSQNLSVELNTRFAEEQFEIFKNTGSFDYSKVYGEKAESISGNLNLANILIKSMGFKQAEEFIQREFTIKDLKVAAEKVLGRSVSVAGKIDDVVNGAAIFGPKIGQGFLQNIMGRFWPVTIDLWMRRTWGRWTGDVVGGGATEESLARLLDAARKHGMDLGPLKGIRVVDRQRKNGSAYRSVSSAVADRLENDAEFNAQVYEVARILDAKGQKHYQLSRLPITPKTKADLEHGNLSYKDFIRDQQKTADRISAEYKAAKKADKSLEKAEFVKEWYVANGHTTTVEDAGELKPEWSKAAKVIKNSLKPIDVPGPADRRVISRVVNGIRERLTELGYETTNADVQAVLWYPEKDLWAKLRGEDESNLKSSYDEQFTNIAKQRGLGPEAIAAAESVTSQRSGAARTGGSDERGTDEGVPGRANEQGSGTGKSYSLQPVSGGHLRYRPGTGESGASGTGEEVSLTPEDFARIASTNKAGHKFGTSVDVYSPADYDGYDLILLEKDGQSATCSISPSGEVGSVTKSPGASADMVFDAFAAAVITGKVRWLNGFDTVLPGIYAAMGFKAVARITFNEEYQPDGWDYKTYAKFNNGKPDVVFMRYTGVAETYTPGEGAMVEDYETAALMVQDGDVSGGDQVNPASYSLAPSSTVDGFYSKLETTLGEKMPASATVEQVLQIAAGGAKAEEIKWSGLAQALPGLAVDGKVSKDAVLKYLADEGRVKFEEVTMDGANRPDEEYGPEDFDRLPLAAQEIISRYDEGEDYANPKMKEELKEVGVEIEIGLGGGITTVRIVGEERAPTKYGQYVLPGGENYREVVLSMPIKATKDDAYRVIDHGGYFTFKSPTKSSRAFNTREEAETALQKQRVFDGAHDEESAKKDSGYTSSHFPDVPNYVAHMRLDEREDAAGNPGLFIEEIQSDRHQAGRKQGYKSTRPAFNVKDDGVEFKIGPESDHYRNNKWGVYSKKTGELVSGMFLDEATASEEADILMENGFQMEENTTGAIPDAPFRNDWPLAMFKRALRGAVASGKEWIGWTTGETQNDRFDLSKQVDEIKYSKARPGKHLIIATKGGEEMTRREVDTAKLPGVVGKDVAQRIVDGGESGVLSGAGLQVGGIGMKGFYDNMLPKEIGKYVKQWGGKVEQAAISNSPLGTFDPTNARIIDRGGVFQVWVKNENGVQQVRGGNFDTRENAEAYMNQGANTPIWRIDITPAMREGVEQGQTSYSLTTTDMLDKLERSAGRRISDPAGRAKTFERMIDKLGKLRDLVATRGVAFNFDSFGQPYGKPITNETEGILNALAILDGILSVLPAELRGRIGGHTNLAKHTTNEARLDYLKRKIASTDKHLEKYLQMQYGILWKKLLAREQVKKNGPGKKPTGKAGADIHDLFAVLREYQTRSSDDAQAHADGLVAQIAKGDLTPQEEAHKNIEAQLVLLVADWKNASAERRADLVKNAQYAFDEGYYRARLAKLMAAEDRKIVRENLIASTGKTGMDPQARDQRAIESIGLGAKIKNASLSLASFEQLVTFIFGESSPDGNRLIDLEREASYAYTDSVREEFDALEQLFSTQAGGGYKGELLRHELAQKNVEIRVDKNTPRTMSQLEMLTATLQWRQEDGRRHMHGHKDENGNYEGAWHYDQFFIDEIERRLSPEAKKVRAHLIAAYGSEWDEINPLFRELNGVNLPKVQHYSPITVSPQQAQSGQTVDPVTGFATSSKSNTPSSLRSRGQAIAEPDFRDALQVYIAHRKQILHWKAYAKFSQEASAILNNRQVGHAIEESAGKEATMMLRKWIDYFAEGGYRDAAAQMAFHQQVSKWVGRGAATALVGRLGVLAIQSTQLGAALAEMPTGSYVKRLGMLLSGNLGWSTAFQSEFVQRRMAQMPVMVAAAVEGLRAAKPGRVKYHVQQIGRLIGGADALFTAGTYAIIYDFQYAQARKDGMDERMSAAFATKAAERGTERVAQPTRAGTRSYLEVSAVNPIWKLSWAFASEARQKLALTAFTLANKDASAARKARAVAVTWVVGGMVATVIRSAWKDMRDDDDDELFDEKNWGWKRLALSTLTGPLGGIPVLGDMVEAGVYGLAGEYLPQGNMLSSVARAPKAISNIPEWFTGERDLEDAIKDAEVILSGMGIFNDTIAAYASLSHLARDLFSLSKNAIDE